MPRDLYTPNYTDLYCKFYYDKTNNCLGVHLYQVIPYKTIDDNLKTIRVLNPNCNLDELLAHNGTEEDYQEKFTSVIDIKQVYTKEQLPTDAIYVGKRAFVDIFYKNDYLGSNDNVFSFFYDIENKNITNELENSVNYLNINPLGMNIKVIKNDYSDVRIGVSLDGFIRIVDEGDNFSARNYYIDPYLKNGLVKDIDLDFYVFPYIVYDNKVAENSDTDFVTNNQMYYVPKDCVIE